MSKGHPHWSRHGAPLSVAWVAFVLSIVVHIFVVAALRSVRHFDFNFEIELPAEVEFGLTEEAVVIVTPGEAEPVAQPSPDLEPHLEAIPATEPEPVPKPKHRPFRKKPPPPPEAKPNAPSEPLRIPAGTQIALRLDLKHVRDSELAKDVERFLKVVPDWKLVLEGSGIDPVADLNRLLIATPNLYRARLIIAGQHRRGHGYTEERVATLANAQGKQAKWRRKYGVKVAAWHDIDPTRRIIAKLDHTTFAVSRAQDLPRILALMQARNEERPSAKQTDALLSLQDQEVVSLEIEGTQRFIRGNKEMLPQRLRAAITQTSPQKIRVESWNWYPDAQSAKAAAAYWRRVRDHYASNPLLALVGVGKAIQRANVTSQGATMRIEARLSLANMRVILSYLEGRIIQRERNRQALQNTAPAAAENPALK